MSLPLKRYLRRFLCECGEAYDTSDEMLSCGMVGHEAGRKAPAILVTNYLDREIQQLVTERRNLETSSNYQPLSIRIEQLRKVRSELLDRLKKEGY